MRGRSILVAAGAAAATDALPRPTWAQAAQIAGAGASFPAAVYAKWAQPAHGPTGVQASYQPTGSSAGADQVAARKVDFAGMDNPKRAGALREQSLIQFPSVMGAVVPYVKLPGV